MKNVGNMVLGLALFSVPTFAINWTVRHVIDWVGPEPLVPVLLIVPAVVLLAIPCALMGRR